MKILTSTIIIVLALLTASPVYAVSGACSWHGGVDCSQVDLDDLSVVCNDGWRDSSISYLEQCTENLNEVFNTMALYRCQEHLSDQVGYGSCRATEYLSLALQNDPQCLLGMYVRDDGQCQCADGEVWNGYTCTEPVGSAVQDQLRAIEQEYCGKIVGDELVVLLSIFNVRSYDYLYDFIKGNCGVDPRDSMSGYLVNWPNWRLTTNQSVPPTATQDQTVAPPKITPDPGVVAATKGRLLLQVEDGGRIWYVSPISGERYEVTFANALPLFQKLSLGVTNTNLLKIAEARETRVGDTVLAAKLKGRLLLQVEDGGRIWYVNPLTLKRHEVTWANLMDLFRSLALGVTDANLGKLQIGTAD